MRGGRTLIVLAALGTVSCLTGGGVVRITHGEETRGRFISDEAYLAFVRGALAEARGDLKRAAREYERVLDADSDSAEAWSGLGRVRCTTSAGAADEAFSRAMDLGPQLSTPFLSAAACALSRGHTSAAESLALRGVERAPLDPDATALLSEILRQAGKEEISTRWVRGLGLLRGDAPPSPAAENATKEAPLSAARRRFGAEPRSADARITLLVEADLAGDDVAFELASRRPQADLDEPSPEAAERLAALLTRRVGDGAARAFQAAQGAAGAAGAAREFRAAQGAAGAAGAAPAPER